MSCNERMDRTRGGDWGLPEFINSGNPPTRGMGAIRNIFKIQK